MEIDCGFKYVESLVLFFFFFFFRRRRVRTRPPVRIVHRATKESTFPRRRSFRNSRAHRRTSAMAKSESRRSVFSSLLFGRDAKKERRRAREKMVRREMIDGGEKNAFIVAFFYVYASRRDNLVHTIL